MGKYDPILVVPDSFFHVSSELQSLRDQVEEPELRISDPFGIPDGVLFTKHWDFIDGVVEDFWEGELNGD